MSNLHRAGRITARMASLALTGVLVLAGLAFCFLAVGPHVLGYRTQTMLTGSMEPGIMPGDVVVSRSIEARDIQVGDVISYRIPVEDHRVETHRITRVTTGTDGRVTIVTQGDNNSNVDPWTATLDTDTAWKTVAVVPKLGSAIRTLRTPLVQQYGIWVALGGLLVAGLLVIWRDEDDEEEDDEDEDAAEDAELAGESHDPVRV